uniref:Plus3 domain-containing protein n=1 Tax=Hyaloperonospora arabidopsidis (strain Emoy2) TaxID=559515 RepID=M4BP43_HYAAE
MATSKVRGGASGDESDGGRSSASGSVSSRSGSHSSSGSDSSRSGSGSDSGSGSGSGSDSGSESESGSGSRSGSGSNSSSGSDGSASDSSVSKKRLKKRRAVKPKAAAAASSKPKSRNSSRGTKSHVQKQVKIEADAEADDEREAGGKRRRGTLRIKDEEMDEEKKEDDDVDVTGLTEVEKEKRLLEKYEAKEQRNKERELKKRLAASQGKAEDGFSEEGEEGEEHELPSTRRGGRSRESDRRKEALHNLKANKSSDKNRSILSNRFGDEGSSDEEGGSRSGRDLAEKRRRRRELQRGGTGRRRSHADDDEDYSDDDSDGRRRKKSKAVDPTATTKTGEEDDLAASIRPEENVPVNWNQANFYLLKRRVFFEKNFFEPFFPQLVRGVYVRVPIEMVDGEMVYRFCEVVNVCKLPRSYNFCGESTHMGIICAFGKSRREWKLSGVSGHSLREREFLLWRAAINKDRLHFPTHGEVKRVYSKKEKMITQHNYTEAQVDEMVRRKQAVGLSTVSLGVQRVRLERDLRAAQDMKNFEKAVVLEERLQRLLAKNEERKNHNSDDVLRINEINRRNREANIQQDLHAQELNDAMKKKMTSAERLQFVRANQMTMFMSRDKLEKNLAEGKLIKLADGRVMTSNKLHTVEALPDDLLDKVKGVGEKKQNGDDLEFDIDRLLAKQRERKQKDAERLAATQKEHASQVEFVGVAPTNIQERANATVRIKDDDGSWMTLRSPAEIIKAKQNKTAVSDKVKASRKGITVKEYFDRVKKRRVAH